MIAILFAAARIPPGRLQMAARLDGNPNVAIRRRNSEARDTFQFLGGGEPAVLRSEVSKPPTRAQTPDARLRVRHINESGLDRHLRRFGGDAGEICCR